MELDTRTRRGIQQFENQHHNNTHAKILQCKGRGNHTI